MAVYLTVVPFILIGKLVSVRCHEKYENLKRIDLFLTFIPFLMMALIIGLRGPEVGSDTNNYLSIASWYENTSYKDILLLSLGRGGLTGKATTLEFGFELVTKFLYDTFHTEQALLIFMPCVTFFCFWITVNYLSDDPYLSTLIIFSTGFFTNSLNIARQLTVVGLMCVAYIFILKKRWGLSILMTLIGCSFHQTAIIPFLFYLFIRQIPLRRKYALYDFASMLMLVVLIHPIATIFVKFFPKYTTFITKTDLLAKWGMIRFVWIFEIFITFYLLMYAFGNIEKKEMTLYDRHLFCTICFTYLYIGLTYCSQYVWLVSRIGFYFQLGTVFLFPMILIRLRQNAPKPFYFFCTVMLYLFFIVWFIFSIKNDPMNVYSSPYLTLFFNP